MNVPYGMKLIKSGKLPLQIYCKAEKYLTEAILYLKLTACLHLPDMRQAGSKNMKKS